jgi:hypothetical protein
VGKPDAGAHDEALAYAARAAGVPKAVLREAIEAAQGVSRLGAKSVGAGRVEDLVDALLKARV